MSIRRFFPGILFLTLLAMTCTAKEAPAPRTVTLTAADGTALKASYFAAAKPGPGVMLMHQCNRQRKVWDELAGRLASLGINVLTIDNRGFGESGGDPFDKLSPEDARKVRDEKWPGDFDSAFQYLVSQPGVRREAIGAGGASCGVNNSIQLARRHPEVKSLVLLSGGTDRDGRSFLQSQSLAIFSAAADDDGFGNLTDVMRWLASIPSNRACRFAEYATGGHGSDMFPVHKELPELIAQWFLATLTQHPEKAPKTNATRFAPQVMRNLEWIEQPGGASKLEKTLVEARARDAQAAPGFPEGVLNLLGYEHIQLRDTKGAVEILKLNATAYPNSANVYDSLADAYLADGQKDLARANFKKALEMLSNDTTGSQERRDAIRQSAERKLKQLESPQTN